MSHSASPARPAIVVRPAQPSEFEAAYRIYIHYIETGTHNWNHRPKPFAAFAAGLAAVQAAGRPLLVAVSAECAAGTADANDANGADIADGVQGFAMLHDFRSPDGYWPCVENSIYVRPGQHGLGIGGTLMAASIEQARATGVWAIIAVIDAMNRTSIRFHERHGFRQCGVLENIGEKNGVALSAVFMQYDLPENRERFMAAQKKERANHEGSGTNGIR